VQAVGARGRAARSGGRRRSRDDEPGHAGRERGDGGQYCQDHGLAHRIGHGGSGAPGYREATEGRVDESQAAVPGADRRAQQHRLEPGGAGYRDRRWSRQTSANADHRTDLARPGPDSTLTEFTGDTTEYEGVRILASSKPGNGVIAFLDNSIVVIGQMTDVKPAIRRRSQHTALPAALAAQVAKYSRYDIWLAATGTLA